MRSNYNKQKTESEEALNYHEMPQDDVEVSWTVCNGEKLVMCGNERSLIGANIQCRVCNDS